MTSGRMAAAVLAATVAACGSLLGLDGYEPVDCVGSCGDAGALPDAARPSDGAVADASADADAASACVDLAPCASGHPIEVRVVGSGDVQVWSDPAGIVARPGETATACVPAGRLRLDLSSGTAEWHGASCEEGSPADDCELRISGPTCVTVVLR